MPIVMEERNNYPPVVRDNYKKGYANILTDQRIQFFLKALSQGKNDDLWVRVREGELKMASYKYAETTKIGMSHDTDMKGNPITYEVKTVNSERNYITRGKPLEENDIPDKKTWLEDMEVKLEKLTDYHADLFMDIIAQSMFLKDGDETFWYDLSEFLDRRGLKRKQGEDTEGKAIHCHERKNLRFAYSAFLDIANIWVIDEQRTDTITKDARLKRKPKINKKGMKLMALLTYYANNEYVACENMEEEELEARNPTPTRWKIRIGDWLRDGSETFAYTPFHQILLSYDPYRQWLEKRLARYCIFYRRANIFKAEINKGFIKGVSVKKLIESVSMEIEDANPKRSKDRFEKALDQLKTDKIIRGWKYKNDNSLTSKFWLNDWYTNQIIFSFHPKKENETSNKV